MTKQLKIKTTIQELESLMTEKTDERSKLNYEITQIRETIEMVKSVKVKK